MEFGGIFSFLWFFCWHWMNCGRRFWQPKWIRINRGGHKSMKPKSLWKNGPPSSKKWNWTWKNFTMMMKMRIVLLVLLVLLVINKRIVSEIVPIYKIQNMKLIDKWRKCGGNELIFFKNEMIEFLFSFHAILDLAIQFFLMDLFFLANCTDVCSAGFCPDVKNCSLCLPGTYNNQINASFCPECPDGSWSDWVDPHIFNVLFFLTSTSCFYLK